MLLDYFTNLNSGPGLWKWTSYFDLYEEQFGRYRDTEVVLVEVGIFSGGSLRMWREYLGAKALIHGVDISPSVKAYEGMKKYGTPRIFVGAQSDSAFWSDVKSHVPPIDVFIDDGSHISRDQQTTFLNMWPHIAPRGLYWIEDVAPLNTINPSTTHFFARLSLNKTFMSDVKSITTYNGVIVLQKSSAPFETHLWKKGTLWQAPKFWSTGGPEQQPG